MYESLVERPDPPQVIHTLRNTIRKGMDDYY